MMSHNSGRPRGAEARSCLGFFAFFRLTSRVARVLCVCSVGLMIRSGA